MKSSSPARSRAGSVLALAFTVFVLGIAFPHVARAVGSGLLPYLEEVSFTGPICPGDSIDVHLAGTFPSACYQLERTEIVPTFDNGPGPPPPPSLRITYGNRTACATCPPVPTPWSADVRMPGRPTNGPAWLPLEGYETDLCRPDSSATFLGTFQASFTVRCGSPPFLDSVVFEDPICPGDSIDVFLTGRFDDACLHLRSVEVLPSREVPPGPVSSRILLTYGGINSCLPCGGDPVPWSAHVRLPGLPPSGGEAYQLPIDADFYDTCDGTTTPLGGNLFPFTVAEDCSTGAAPCFNVAWGPDPTLSTPGCDGTYGNNIPTDVGFSVGSTVAIAGVQGRLVLDTVALRIVAVQATRESWAVQSTRNPDGSVSFVAFATSGGAALPGHPSGTPQDLLVVRVEPSEARIELPDRAHLAALDLLVSDAGGRAVRMCPFILASVVPPPWVAVLCKSGGLCDSNQDGQSDVRDLVVMVQCLSSLVDCPPSLVMPDCDADSTFDLDDVFCCARAILNGGDPVPPDSARAAPEVALRFGLPREGEGGVLDVPLTLHGLGAAEVGALRINVAYPDARYEVVGIELVPAPSDWWMVHDVEGGRIRLALIDLSPTANGDEPMSPTVDLEAIRIRLRPRDGVEGGGEITVAAHDFAARDGVTLTTPNAEATVVLGATGPVALSVPRPNPFAAGTSLALTLHEAGAVDVGVFDVSGRRVATLLRESQAPAGVHALRWDGIDASGTRVAGGVYFVRVVGPGADRASTRKLLFLPGGTR